LRHLVHVLDDNYKLCVCNHLSICIHVCLIYLCIYLSIVCMYAFNISKYVSSLVVVCDHLLVLLVSILFLLVERLRIDEGLGAVMAPARPAFLSDGFTWLETIYQVCSLTPFSAMFLILIIDLTLDYHFLDSDRHHYWCDHRYICGTA